VKFLPPVDLSYCAVSQDYAGHLETAKKKGWCSFPGAGCKTYYYPGVDLYPLWSAPDRVLVKAPHDGRITKAAPDKGGITSGYGLEIRISIPGTNNVTILAHLDVNDDVFVKVGDFVKAGDGLAYMDNTGFSTGKHVHWEHRVNDRAVDPWPMLAAPVEEGDEVEVTVPVQILSPEIVEALKTIPWFRVKSTTLRVRSGAGVGYATVGILQEGDAHPFVAYIQVSEDEAWIQFGRNQFCAAVFQNERLCELYMPKGA